MTIKALQEKKEPIVCLTAYTAPIAHIADAHCDLILVGDSVAMVLYGEDTTQNADVEMMIRHGKAVTKAATKAIVIVDMPFGSYEASKEQALENAQRIMSETGCDGVKLEGGAAMANTIAYLVEHNIPVMGHIGLLPQSVDSPSGFKVKGKDVQGAQQLMQDAAAVEEAGAFCFVIEAVPPELAAAITGKVGIPTIGIGASAACDGQILVTEDMIGMSDRKAPKFVKQFAQIHENIEAAIQGYAQEVQSGAFPAEENLYSQASKPLLKKAS
ncbi:MAG: 3-methyl-2-oxobutanoate hydroxymethyltransferase [Pseudomonadota bacterium]